MSDTVKIEARFAKIELRFLHDFVCFGSVKIEARFEKIELRFERIELQFVLPIPFCQTQNFKNAFSSLQMFLNLFLKIWTPKLHI